MSRKSARLQCRRKEPISEPEEQEIVATFSRKRRVEEELERRDEVLKRRQQFRDQTQWVPISEPHTSLTACMELPGDSNNNNNSQHQSPSGSTSPHHDHVTPRDQLVCTDTDAPQHHQPPRPPVLNNFRLQNVFTASASIRHSPLPTFQWADSAEVWQLMLRKEQLYVKDVNMLDRHTSLQARMRAILLDWLIEVCEVYRLHRESYYLAVDFIDRFLCCSQGIQKQQLQLIGITALFVAAKLEEIYPPKLADFAYVTDGACTENEILEQELVLLKALKWDLSPMTCNSWLNVYLQLVNVDNMEKEHNFVFPQYSSHAFIQIARLLDLCLLDVGCLQFTHSTLATSALYHMTSEHVALSVSGYQWTDIAPCVQWMSPFAMTLREVGPIELKFFKEISPENTHNIQTHAVDLSLLEKAQARQAALMTTDPRASPDLSQEIPGIITPPHSDKAKSKQSHSITVCNHDDGDVGHSDMVILS